MTAEVKSRATERVRAADLWHDEGWVFTNHIGKPVHPTVDHEAWKSLLKRRRSEMRGCAMRGIQRRRCC